MYIIVDLAENSKEAGITENMGKHAVYIDHGMENVFDAICNFHGMSGLAFALSISIKFIGSKVTKKKRKSIKKNLSKLCESINRPKTASLCVLWSLRS